MPSLQQRGLYGVYDSWKSTFRGEEGMDRRMPSWQWDFQCISCSISRVVSERMSSEEERLPSTSAESDLLGELVLDGDEEWMQSFTMYGAPRSTKDYLVSSDCPHV